MNSIASDDTLLRQFADEGSEEAFAELVARHIDRVYSAALRQLGNGEAAKDAAQIVFIRLAQNAKDLPKNCFLSGWLNRATFYAASDVRRHECRHRNRMKTFADELESPDEESRHKHFAPHLDAAINSLREADRKALLLRFFDRMSLAGVGEALGVREDAARKRVDRALERLRIQLRAMGVTSSSTALSAALQNMPVIHAPAGIAALVASTATSKASVAIITASTPILMNTMKAKIAVGAALATAVTLPILVHLHHANAIRAQQFDLNALKKELDDVSADADRWKTIAEQAETKLRQREAELSELVRLRAELAAMRRKEDQAKQTEPVDDAQNHESMVAPEVEPVIRYSAQLVADVPKGETLIAGGWEVAPGHRLVVLLNPSTTLSSDGSEVVVIENKFVRIPEEALTKIGWADVRTDNSDSNLGWLASPSTTPAIENLLKTDGVEIISSPKVTTRDGIQAEIAAIEPVIIDNAEYDLGPSVNVIPRILSDQSGIKLVVIAQMAVAKDESDVTKSALPIPNSFLSPPRPSDGP